MKYLLSSLLLLFSTSIIANQSINQTLAADKQGNVKIRVVSTDLEVVAWEKAEVRVVGELDDDIEEFIFEKSGNSILIEVRPENNSSHHWGGYDNAHLTIHVPSGSSVQSTAVSSDFTAIGVHGGLDATTVSGDIELSDITNGVEAESVSGDIELAKGGGKMKLTSVSGDITAVGKAQQFVVQTVSGDIEASIGKSDFVDLNSVSGDIEISFELAKDGRVDGSTVSGDIVLNFQNKTVNARFDLDTGPGGDIENSITRDRPDSSFIGSEEISFSSGNGDGSVELNTMSGTIELNH